jgi:hypothetical protein
VDAERCEVSQPSSCNAFRRSSEPQCRVVVQFGQEASKTRDYSVARSATPRAAHPDPSLRKERLLQDDNQTESLPMPTPRSSGGTATAPSLLLRLCHPTRRSSTAVRFDHAILKIFVMPGQLGFAFMEEYRKKTDNDFRFGNRLVYPPPRSMLFIDLASVPKQNL